VWRRSGEGTEKREVGESVEEFFFFELSAEEVGDEVVAREAELVTSLVWWSVSATLLKSINGGE
jgi:hypothetical protein